MCLVKVPSTTKHHSVLLSPSASHLSSHRLHGVAVNEIVIHNGSDIGDRDVIRRVAVWLGAAVPGVVRQADSNSARMELGNEGGQRGQATPDAVLPSWQISQNGELGALVNSHVGVRVP